MKPKSAMKSPPIRFLAMANLSSAFIVRKKMLPARCGYLVWSIPITCRVISPSNSMLTFDTGMGRWYSNSTNIPACISLACNLNPAAAVEGQTAVVGCRLNKSRNCSGFLLHVVVIGTCVVESILIASKRVIGFDVCQSNEDSTGAVILHVLGVIFLGVPIQIQGTIGTHMHITNIFCLQFEAPNNLF